MRPENYPVRWADTAKRDLEGIIECISRDSPSNAKQVLKKIQDVCAALSAMPMRGRIVPELQQQGIFTYHELQSPPWRIIYRISKHCVFVLAVFDARRSLEDLLLERFTR